MNGQASSKPNAFVRKGFKITTQKLPILKSGPIEDMTKNLGIAPPEMIFGDNFVTIQHPASAWGIAFNAFDALDRVDKTGASMLKVAYSKEWQQSRYSLRRRCEISVGQADPNQENIPTRGSRKSLNRLTGPTVLISKELYNLNRRRSVLLPIKYPLSF